MSLLKRTAEENEAKFSSQVAQDMNRLGLHLMPKVGWMNDPNGLCQFKDVYHVFFQYSPWDPNGGQKAWGHYTTKDLIHWQWEEAVLFPDQPFDKDGVYSGAAFVTDEKMYLYYTGNVKQPGSHDYITSGREANTVLVTSEDGMHFSNKQLIMTNADYPNNYTCHIRDPKVWEEDGTYYMVQGARREDDQGTVLLFTSKDLVKWEYEREITTKSNFGFMWECPDYFMVDKTPILSCSPQGVEAKTYRYQNVYQSGYFILPKSVSSKEVNFVEEKDFVEWDMGFDFYAPQTFEDASGRRLLMGWAGIPDADYDNEPTTKIGWQHALTLPRHITVKEGKVLQNPIEELKQLRKEEIPLVSGEHSLKAPIFELEVKGSSKPCEVVIGEGEEKVSLTYEEGVLCLSLSEKAGRGRTTRKCQLQSLEKLRLIVDTSLLEVYVNDGETVFTTRFYFDSLERTLSIKGDVTSKMWYLNEMDGL